MRVNKKSGKRSKPKTVLRLPDVEHSKNAVLNSLPSARLCHLVGGELEQIQFLLGQASVQTTERYLGYKQKLRHAVNDAIGLEDA